MNTEQKMVFIVPHWKNKQHHSTVRVERFLRWTRKAGFKTTIICAGNVDRLETNDYGNEIILKDILGFYKESNNDLVRKKNNLLRIIRFFIRSYLIPDNGTPWGWRVFFSIKVKKAIKQTNFILSSSPPESSHLVAYRLAKKYNKKHIVDFRDGWIDDPLRENLKRKSIRRTMEERLEKKVIGFAYKIFVTSREWGNLLFNRYKSIEGKVDVLTNAYPQNYKVLYSKEKKKNNTKIELIHTGRFTQSDPRRKVSILLIPILKYLTNNNIDYRITLLGKLTNRDIKEIGKIQNIGNKLRQIDNVSRDKMLEMINEMEGLLVLSTSYAALPSKIFEYIPAKKPILAFSKRSSALWELFENISYCFNFDYNDKDEKILDSFFKEVQEQSCVYSIPIEFAETSLEKIFLSKL